MEIRQRHSPSRQKPCHPGHCPQHEFIRDISRQDVGYPLSFGDGHMRYHLPDETTCCPGGIADTSMARKNLAIGFCDCDKYFVDKLRRQYMT